MPTHIVTHIIDHSPRWRVKPEDSLPWWSWLDTLSWVLYVLMSWLCNTSAVLRVIDSFYMRTGDCATSRPDYELSFGIIQVTFIPVRRTRLFFAWLAHIWRATKQDMVMRWVIHEEEAGQPCQKWFVQRTLWSEERSQCIILMQDMSSKERGHTR